MVPSVISLAAFQVSVWPILGVPRGPSPTTHKKPNRRHPGNGKLASGRRQTRQPTGPNRGSGGAISPL